MRKWIVAFVALVSVSAMAQNVDIEALSGLQFNFGNPGARSLGMGGAFLGLADDASAAEANRCTLGLPIWPGQDGRCSTSCAPRSARC